MIYDVIIIGGGISGLYAAYKMRNHKSFLVLEKNRKPNLGGRAGNELFQGVNVVTGAGIGRKRKDRLLYKLIGELGLQTQSYVSKKYYSPDIDPLPMEQIMQYLREKYSKTVSSPQTFKQFATQHLGPKVYKRFLETSGYTDYEKEDAYETLNHYGMDDNYKNSTIFTVAWKQLVDTLASKIGESKIKMGNGVSKIRRQIDTNSIPRFYLETDLGTTYICNEVIVATDINGIRALLPNPIYKEIEGQPFIRIYGKFSKQSIPYLKQHIRGYTCVKGPLQKIIPMDVERGVYMIAYSDNAAAEELSTLTDNEETREILCRMVEVAMGIPSAVLSLTAIKSYYWRVGTHYYKPLKLVYGPTREDFIEKVQNPGRGIMVVGEAVSRNQGWTEGALESVEKVITKKWLHYGTPSL